MVLTIHESFDKYPKWLVTYCWALLWRFVCSTQEYPLLCCCHLGCNIHKWAFLDISLPCPHRIYWTNFTCVQVSGLHSAWSFTAKPLSSMQNCLKSRDLALAMEIKPWFTGDAHTSRHPRPVSLALLGSHPHLGDPYQMTRLSNNSTIIFNHYFSTFVWSAVYIAGQRGLSPSRQKVLPPIGRSLPSSFLICLI